MRREKQRLADDLHSLALAATKDITARRSHNQLIVAGLFAWSMRGYEDRRNAFASSVAMSRQDRPRNAGGGDTIRVGVAAELTTQVLQSDRDSYESSAVLIEFEALADGGCYVQLSQGTPSRMQVECS